MDTVRALDDINDDIKRYSRTLEDILKFRTFVEKYQSNLEMITYEGYIALNTIIFQVRSMEELHEVRRELRKAFKKYTDERGLTWFTGVDIATDFGCNNYPLIIRFSAKPDEFPKELQSEKCKVTKLPDRVFKSTPNYAFVCKEVENE